MNLDVVISYLNFFSRWVLFVAVAYKAFRTKEKGWILLAGAFFINALDVESYILKHLGIAIRPEVYHVASKIPNFFVAILAVWGAVHLRYGESRVRHTVYFVIFSVAAYIWLILLAADVFGGNRTLMATFPSLALGGALVYLGIVLGRDLPPSHKIDLMFPLGLILLGILNLTYPVTRFIDWFKPIGFFLGGMFRLMATLGAVKFVFYPFKPVGDVEKAEISPGAFLVANKTEGQNIFRKLLELPGVVFITRRDFRNISKDMPANSLVFWITRAKEGKINEEPQVYAIAPTRMDILTDLVARAIESGYRVIYMDAFEYLMIENGFESTLKFVLNVKDRTISIGGSMFLVLDTDALTQQQLRIIKREFEQIS